MPTLIIISGPAGSGKTTLAHEFARAIPCPAICRDEIKEGMVHATPGFEPAPGDPLTQRTLGVFFEVLRVLLAAGVTVVAEAAFQDHVWRPNLEPLLGLAELRIVHCRADADIARDRQTSRGERAAHADAAAMQGSTAGDGRPSFTPLALDAPSIHVDTSDGYEPSMDDVLAFVTG